MLRLWSNVGFRFSGFPRVGFQVVCSGVGSLFGLPCPFFYFVDFSHEGVAVGLRFLLLLLIVLSSGWPPVLLRRVVAIVVGGMLRFAHVGARVFVYGVVFFQCGLC